jgi:hypothetical protein
MADAPATPAHASPSAPTIAPFTDMVWGAFAGAEPFADGGEPIFAEGHFTLGACRAWILVLDATGGCLCIDGDPQSDYGGYSLGRPFASAAEAEAWFAREVRAPAHLLDFLMAGFTRV